VRVVRETEISPAVLELCVDDVWLRYSAPDPPPPPQNLQLSQLTSDDIFLSWGAPPAGEEVTGYTATCSLAFSLTTTGISATIPLIGLQEHVNYTCCVTAEQGTGASSPNCGSIDAQHEKINAVSTSDSSIMTGVSDSILVPVLGVLAGVFFLAVVVVSVSLVVFVCTDTKRRSERADIAEPEEKE
jgi:hypothetical protein